MRIALSPCPAYALTGGKIIMKRPEIHSACAPIRGKGPCEPLPSRHSRPFSLSETLYVTDLRELFTMTSRHDPVAIKAPCSMSPTCRIFSFHIESMNIFT